jgi:hypothetical protein
MEILAEETCTIGLCGMGCSLICILNPDSFILSSVESIVIANVYPLEG